MGIFENFNHGKADEPGFDPKWDETIALKLTPDEQQEFDVLTELVLAMPKNEDGAVDEAGLAPEEAFTLNRYRELEARGKAEWRRTGSM